MFDRIKPSGVTVTVKAQLSQGLHVYRFFTQGCFKFLDPERTSSVRSDWRTRGQPEQARGGGSPQRRPKVSQAFWAFRNHCWNRSRSHRSRPVLALLWCRLATSEHTGAGWPPVHISQGGQGGSAWPSTKAANEQGLAPELERC